VINEIIGDDSPAKRQDRAGGRCRRVDGQSVETVAQLQQRVGFKKPGDIVQVTVSERTAFGRQYR